MAQVPIVFGLQDVGCYAEGCFGHDHARARLADLLQATYPAEHPETPEDVAEVLAALQGGEMSDDAWEEQAAIDLLNERCSRRVYFAFEEGELRCVDAAQDDDGWGDAPRYTE